MSRWWGVPALAILLAACPAAGADMGLPSPPDDVALALPSLAGGPLEAPPLPDPATVRGAGPLLAPVDPAPKTPSPPTPPRLPLVSEVPPLPMRTSPLARLPVSLDHPGGTFLEEDDLATPLLARDGERPPQPSPASPAQEEAVQPFPPAVSPEALAGEGAQQPDGAPAQPADLPGAAPQGGAASVVVSVPGLPAGTFAILLAFPLALASGWLLGRLHALALFVHLDREEALGHPNRRRLLEMVISRPGARLRDLVEASGLSRNNTAYHLNILQRGGLVSSVGFGRERHLYYAAAPDGALAQRAVLQDVRRWRIAAFVLEHPSCFQRQVSEALLLRPNRVHEQVRLLEDVGLLARRRRGRTVRLHPTAGLQSMLRSMHASGTAPWPPALWQPGAGRRGGLEESLRATES